MIESTGCVRSSGVGTARRVLSPAKKDRWRCRRTFITTIRRSRRAWAHKSASSRQCWIPTARNDQIKVNKNFNFLSFFGFFFFIFCDLSQLFLTFSFLFFAVKSQKSPQTSTKPPRKQRLKPQKQIEMTIDEILKQPGTNTAYVPTSFGAMKVSFNGFLFAHHFTRNCIARYRCDHHDKSKCPASIVIKEKLTYPHNSHHNHRPAKKN